MEQSEEDEDEDNVNFCFSLLFLLDFLVSHFLKKLQNYKYFVLVPQKQKALT